MIEKFGKVTITDKEVLIELFCFRGGNPKKEVLEWAIERLENILKDSEENENKFINLNCEET